MSPRYRVELVSNQRCEVVVEAEDEQEARDLARDFADAGEYEREWDAFWSPDEVTLLDEEGDDD